MTKQLFILTINYTDGCTYSSDRIIPVYANTKEEIIKSIKDTLENLIKDRPSITRDEIIWKNEIVIPLDNFIYSDNKYISKEEYETLPDNTFHWDCIETIDTWIDREKTEI